jgi:phage baseplate assembly protein W
VSSVNRPRGYRLAETRRGDTLQDVAARELGDASRWPEIVALNGLAPPYIVDTLAQLQDTPAGQVLIAGQTIKLPAPPRRVSAVPDEDIYGTDLLLDRDGKLVVDETTGDFATVSGPANLAQAIRNRFATPEGSLTWHPKYGNGLFRLLGKGINNSRRMLAQVYAERAMRSDPRVASAENIVVEVAGDRIAASGHITGIDGKRLPVAVGDEGE